MTDTLIENVSDTAFWIAHYRAVESARPDALFRDPLAALLAGEQGEKIARTMPMSFMTEWVVAIRTHIIDGYIRTAIAQGIDTVVNLGAGLDTRPYRMDLPEAFHWIEVDYPRMIEFKESRLAREVPRCKLERVAVDLADRVSRQRLLADVDSRSKKLLILTEGVVTYLSVDEAGTLAKDLKATQHVYGWIVDYLSPYAMKWRQRGRLAQKTKNAPFKFKPADWFAFFLEHGWRVKEMRYLAEEGDRLKRRAQPPFLLKAVLSVRMLLLSKERRAELKKLAGYALLEPVNATGALQWQPVSGEGG
jgi:methyltransferase (TIGR00027 family)